MATQVRLRSAGMASLLKSDDVREQLDGPAARVLAAAQSGAPVESGAYRDNLRIVDDTTDRAVKRIVSDAPHAMIVEARTGNLARALGAAG